MIGVLARLGLRPRFCVWELTLACDMRCRHCGSRAGKPRADELSTPELLHVADELCALGCERATLSGGEPTLHAHWDVVARRLRNGGVRVNIISNGWSWTAEHTRRAIDSGLENVAFSLDGQRHEHDLVRGKPGSFDRVARAIDDCVAAGAAVTVVTHLNELNKRGLSALHGWLAERGVSSWQLQVGNPGGSMSDSRELVIPPTDLLWLVPEIAALMQSGRRPVVFPADNIGYYGKFERTLRDRGATICFWIGCRAGCQVVGIESDGNVKGCLSLPSARNGVRDFVEGNLRETSLRELWTRQGAFAYNRNDQVERLEGFCGKCRFRDLCRGGCSWSAFTRSGSRFDNPMCFYRVAVEQKRWDLIPDAEVDLRELEIKATDLDDPGIPV